MQVKTLAADLVFFPFFSSPTSELLGIAKMKDAEDRGDVSLHKWDLPPPSETFLISLLSLQTKVRFHSTKGWLQTQKSNLPSVKSNVRVKATAAPKNRTPKQRSFLSLGEKTSFSQRPQTGERRGQTSCLRVGGGAATGKAPLLTHTHK